MKVSQIILSKILSTSLFCICSTMITGCASIVSGHQQSVSVTTTPVYGASCTLANNKGTWYVPSTPGSVVINRSYENLNVDCKKKGYGRAHKSIASSTKAMAFGNVIFGGLIGGAVDVASGAAYDYPQEIRLPIESA